MVYEDMGIVDVNGKDVYDKKRVYDLYVVDIIVWEVIENGKVGVFVRSYIVVNFKIGNRLLYLCFELISCKFLM